MTEHFQGRMFHYHVLKPRLERGAGETPVLLAASIVPGSRPARSCGVPARQAGSL